LDFSNHDGQHQNHGSQVHKKTKNNKLSNTSGSQENKVCTQDEMISPQKPSILQLRIGKPPYPGSQTPDIIFVCLYVCLFIIY